MATIVSVPGPCAPVAQHRDAQDRPCCARCGKRDWSFKGGRIGHNVQNEAICGACWVKWFTSEAL
jgi:hypothetical protein